MNKHSSTNLMKIFSNVSSTKSISSSKISRSKNGHSNCKTAYKRIALNVGGRKFVVKEGLFDKFPSCILSSHTIGVFYDKEKNEHFFDRDPDAFKYIVEYCRTGRLHVSDDECFSAILDELDFFMIPTENVFPDTCCEEDYGPNIKQLIEKHTTSKLHDQAIASTDFSEHTKETFRSRIWKLTSQEDSSIAASIYSCAIHFITVMSAVFIAVETVSCEVNVKCGSVYPHTFFIAEVVCVAIFTTDYLAKLWSAPKRYKFLRGFLNVIDVLALVPFYLTLILKYFFDIHKDYSFMAILRLFRVFRIIKLAKRSEKIRAIITSANDSGSTSTEIFFILFGLLMLLLVFSTIIFFFEQTSTDTQFTNIPETLWYTAVTVTSLGYGDMVPVTIIGKFFGIMTILFGFLGSSLLIPVVQMKELWNNFREGAEKPDGESLGKTDVKIGRLKVNKRAKM